MKYESRHIARAYHFGLSLIKKSSESYRFGKLKMGKTFSRDVSKSKNSRIGEKYVTHHHLSRTPTVYNTRMLYFCVWNPRAPCNCYRRVNVPWRRHGVRGVAVRGRSVNDGATRTKIKNKRWRRARPPTLQCDVAIHVTLLLLLFISYCLYALCKQTNVLPHNGLRRSWRWYCVRGVTHKRTRRPQN